MAEENGLSDHSCYRMNLRQVYGTTLYSEQREHLKCKYDVSARIRNIGPDGHKEYRSYGEPCNLHACAEEALELINTNRMKALRDLSNGNAPPAYDTTTPTPSTSMTTFDPESAQTCLLQCTATPRKRSTRSRCCKKRSMYLVLKCVICAKRSMQFTRFWDKIQKHIR